MRAGVDQPPGRLQPGAEHGVRARSRPQPGPAPPGRAGAGRRRRPGPAASRSTRACPRRSRPRSPRRARRGWSGSRQLHVGVAERLRPGCPSRARRRRPPAPWPGSRSRSAQNSTRTSGNAVRLRRYWLLMLPQPTTATPKGLPRSSGRRPRRWPSPAAPASQARLSPTAVSMSVAHRSSSTTCHSADGQAARMSATGIRPVPTAVIGSSLVHRAVLHVQVADPVAEPAEQGGHVLAADRRPVGVDLEEHGRVERVREHLEARPAADEGGQLEVVVVVAEPQPVVGRLGGGLVELAGERRERRRRRRTARAAPTARSPCRADRCGRRAAARRRPRRGPACTEHTASPASSRSARSRSGSVRTS